jgi:hypothetical protein
MPEKPSYGQRVVTPVGRISFPKWPDDTGPYADGKFKCTLIFPKDDEASAVALRRIIEDLAIKTFGGDDFVSPIRDGDESSRDEYAGHYYITPRSQWRPGFIDADRRNIDPSEINPGDYVRVSVTPYSYKGANGSGISLGLGNVQLVRTGEPFAGGIKAEDEFADDLAVDSF